MLKRILASATLAVLAGAAPIGSVRVVALSGADDIPHPAVVVLWATWCAPCARELPLALKMAPAAAPLPMVSLALDPPARAAARLAELKIPRHRAFAAPGDVKATLEALGGEPARLPLAIAIDAKGEICGARHGLLGGDQLRQWAAACSR